MSVTLFLELQFDVVIPLPEVAHSSVAHTAAVDASPERLAEARQIKQPIASTGDFSIIFDFSAYPETLLVETYGYVTFDISTVAAPVVQLAFDVLTPPQIYSRQRNITIRTSLCSGSLSAGAYELLIVPFWDQWRFNYARRWRWEAPAMSGLVIEWAHYGFSKYAVYHKTPIIDNYALLAEVSGPPWRYMYV